MPSRRGVLRAKARQGNRLLRRARRLTLCGATSAASLEPYQAISNHSSSSASGLAPAMPVGSGPCFCKSATVSLASGAMGEKQTSAATLGAAPASFTITLPQLWRTRTVGPCCRGQTRFVAVTSSASEVSGFCTAVDMISMEMRDHNLINHLGIISGEGQVGVKLAADPLAGPVGRLAEARVDHDHAACGFQNDRRKCRRDEIGGQEGGVQRRRDLGCIDVLRKARHPRKAVGAAGDAGHQKVIEPLP